jgi:hypothetical protein
MSSVGALLTVVMITAGALLWWGFSFANGSVHDQLAQQKVFFPEKGSPALASSEIGPYLNRYAGQQLVNGAQAEAYADHFIGVHVKDIAGGKTYAEVSALALRDPKNATLQTQAQLLFRGETLRGLLLNAYAFWKVGQLARIGSIVSFAMAALMLVLTALGFVHAGRVSAKEELLAPPVTSRRGTSMARAG